MSGHPVQTCRSRYPGRIDRAFVSGATPRVWRGIAAHARTCGACRRKLDRLGLVDAALSPSSPLPIAALERVGRRVLAAVPEVRGRHRRRWLAGAGALAAGAAALLFVLMGAEHRLDQTGDTGLSPRGIHDHHGADPDTGWAERMPGRRQPGLRLFCIDATAGSPRVVDAARATARALDPQPLQCMLDGELQLAYTTPDLAGLTMEVVGRDSSGRTFWYAPRSSDQDFLALLPDRIDEPLPWSTRLGVKHDRGVHDISVRFYQEPVAAQGATGEPILVQELHARIDIID